MNRVLWMLWLQGFENAPDIVQLCLRSWKERNPTWRIITLSNKNLGDYVDEGSLATLRGLKVERQKLANLLRLYLIGRHGGVWADATCLCRRPLDEWLPDYLPSGFFAFRNPGPDRILSNWFLAAAKDNALAMTVFDQHVDFFVRNRFGVRSPKDRSRAKALSYLFERNATLAQLWTYPIVTRTVRTYPYFIFHYHFARIVRENAVCRDIWTRTPPLSALGPLKMNRAGLLSPMTDQLRSDLDHAVDPLYKLKWKHSGQSLPAGCILDHIIRTVD